MSIRDMVASQHRLVTGTFGLSSVYQTCQCREAVAESMQLPNDCGHNGLRCNSSILSEETQRFLAERD